MDESSASIRESPLPGSAARRALDLFLLVFLLARLPALAQDCTCGAPCDLLFESTIATSESLTACNTITVIGAEVLASGLADLQAGDSVTFFSGFSVRSDGSLSVRIDSLLGCDPGIDADSDGTDQCLDCDEADPNNWTSCGTCVDGDNDLAWVGCDAYVTLSGPDCDDSNTARKPGVPETCNAVDDNCNGLTDECLVCGAPP